MKWSKEQERAVFTRNKNILVSASAGAGKTTVLIGRLIRLIREERISIEHILAMTFTEAAANEMKRRLAEQLSQVYQESNDEEEKQYISEQISAIGNAQISTIHSFCLSILKEFYYMVDLSAKAVTNIMDDATAATLRKKALKEVFDEQYRKQDETFYELHYLFSTRPESDEELKQAVTTLASMASSQSDPVAWLRQCAQRYRPISQIVELPEDIRYAFFAYLMRLFTIYKYDLETLSKHVALCYEGSDAHLKITEMHLACDACMEQLQKQEYTAFREQFIGICHIGVPTPPKEGKEDETYKNLRTSIQKTEKKLLEVLYEESLFCKNVCDLYPHVQMLVELCIQYRKAFQKLKHDQECIDFDDMEHYALKILQANDQEVAKHYQERFEEIMVDEFQDSNDVQNLLVSLISRDNNVFRVGDIKQSIYGFRHAKPSLMRDLITNASDNDEVIYLSSNFRSKEMIVDFNNYLFHELMNLPEFDASYSKEDAVTIGQELQKEDNFPIVFHALDAASIKEDQDHFRSNDEIKASYIANQIQHIKKTQNRKWKDFVVLVRANSKKQDLKQVFDELHIPYFIDVKSGFYESNAIQVILSLMHALLNPHNEISFTATMLSPFFQMNCDDLAELKIQKGAQSFYTYMKEVMHPCVMEFEDIRKDAYQLSIHELLNRLYAKNDFYEMHTTNQERTNLDLLFEQAVAFEEKQGKGVLAFLKHIENAKDIETAEAIPIGSEEDVVRVMSIHQSKGLQFPVVFLFSKSNQMAVEFKELFITDSDLGIGIKHMQWKNRILSPTVHRFAIEHKKDKEELEEEMRILYVATTRAQQQMHIVDCVKDSIPQANGLSMPLIYQRKGYTSWILNSHLQTQQHLFTIQHVTKGWYSSPVSIIQNETLKIQRYTKPVRTIRQQSATTYKQEEKFQTLVFENEDALRHGTDIHKAIETLGVLPWDATVLQKYRITLSRSDYDNLMHLQNHAEYQRFCQYPMVAYEHPFMIMDEKEGILHGMIDFLAVGEDIIIIDFKTDRITSVQEIMDRYRTQLSHYAKAMQIIYPDKNVKTYIYSFQMQAMLLVS